jgi:hypothetical protein
MLKEARLVAEAHSRGVPLEKLAERLLKEALTVSSLLHGVLTVEEFHHMLEGMAAGSEKPPNLSTESFSHESFCEDRLGRRSLSIATSSPCRWWSGALNRWSPKFSAPRNCELSYLDRSKMSDLLAGACVRPRKSHCCLIYRGKHLDQLIYLCQFQAMFNHRLCRGYPERTTCPVQLHQAPYDRSNRRAVGMRHARHVKNHPRLARRDHPIHFSLELRAFRSTVYAALHHERGHTWLQSSFCEV